jgi:hypothetical protein
VAEFGSVRSKANDLEMLIKQDLSQIGNEHPQQPLLLKLTDRLCHLTEKLKSMTPTLERETYRFGIRNDRMERYRHEMDECKANHLQHYILMCQPLPLINLARERIVSGW